MSQRVRESDAPSPALAALAVRRRTMARRAGQLWLLPELEWAPFANWMIPARVLRAGQGRLF